jgi:hypothetical protein
MPHSIDVHSAEVAPNVDDTDIAPGKTRIDQAAPSHGSPTLIGVRPGGPLSVIAALSLHPSPVSVGARTFVLHLRPLLT